jgi:hypothetical protein
MGPLLQMVNYLLQRTQIVCRPDLVAYKIYPKTRKSILILAGHA